MNEQRDGTPRSIGLGIDVGGTHTKAALVDLQTGELLSERLSIDTPRPASTNALTGAIRDLVSPLIEQEPDVVGIAFPAVVRRGIVLSAVNIGDDWLYQDLGRHFRQCLGTAVWAVNDADAAALAEVRFGAGRHLDGTIVAVTLGTGVGTSLLVDGRLIPNIEFGELPVEGRPASAAVSNKARLEQRLSWKRWASRLGHFIDALDRAVAPDLVILGGGVIERAHQFVPLITTRPQVLPAKLQNDAGIIGAALFAAEQQRRRQQGARAPQLMVADPDRPTAEAEPD